MTHTPITPERADAINLHAHRVAAQAVVEALAMPHYDLLRLLTNEMEAYASDSDERALFIVTCFVVAVRHHHASLDNITVRHPEYAGKLLDALGSLAYGPAW